MLRLRSLAAAAAGSLLLVVSGVGALATADAPRLPSKRLSVGCGGDLLAKPGGGVWECTFSDEFTGSELDGDKWLAQGTWFSGMTSGNDDCYVADPGALSVGGGKLRLTSRIQDTPFTCRSPNGEFVTDSTAAAVSTRGRFSQAYGRFAFRAKMSAVTVPGSHSALWLYPHAHTYGLWPHSGEIDVAEWFSARPQNVYPSLHYVADDRRVFSGHDCVIPTVSSEYHTYVLEWSPTSMRFFYDGELCFEHSWTPAAPLIAPQPFDRPFNVVLTQAWGALWNAVVPTTPRTATMSVDWVRVWK